MPILVEAGGPRAGLDVCWKSRSHRDSIHGPSSPQRGAIPTTLLRLTYSYQNKYNKIGITCSIHGVNEKHVQNFCPKETLRMIVGKAERNWEDDTRGDIKEQSVKI